MSLLSQETVTRQLVQEHSPKSRFLYLTENMAAEHNHYFRIHRSLPPRTNRPLNCQVITIGYCSPQPGLSSVHRPGEALPGRAYAQRIQAF
jgi:hypothetical protein